MRLLIPWCSPHTKESVAEADGPAGAIAPRPEYIEAFRLQEHRMLAQARQYVLEGYRLSVSRGPNERCPFGRVRLYRPLDDQRAYKATTHAPGATPEPDNSRWELPPSSRQPPLVRRRPHQARPHPRLHRATAFTHLIS